jgi:hypothetical protein
VGSGFEPGGTVDVGTEVVPITCLGGSGVHTKPDLQRADRLLPGGVGEIALHLSAAAMASPALPKTTRYPSPRSFTIDPP